MRSLLPALLLAACSASTTQTSAVSQAPLPLDLSITPPVAAPGEAITFVISGAPPSSRVYLGYSTNGAAPDALCPPSLNGSCLDLRPPVALLSTLRANAQGFASLTVNLPTTVPDGDYPMQAALLLPGAPGEVSDVESLTVASCALRDFYADVDDDGFGDPATAVRACARPPGLVANADDCDDGDAAVNPTAPEVCNGIDDDCDAVLDEEGDTYYLDWDDDGFGDSAVTISACAETTVNDNGVLVSYVATPGDCDDLDDAVNPDAVEVCNSIDDDCDMQVDETGGPTLWYPDDDNDGYGKGPASCSDLLGAGETADGVYTIYPFEDARPLRVYCDMGRGGWTRLVNHDALDGTRFFGTVANGLLQNEEDPESGLYSILAYMEQFRSADGTFEFLLEWPGSTTYPGANQWRQTSDPTLEPIAGDQAIAIDYTAQGWGGLEPANRSEAVMDGTVGATNWFYAVGTTRLWTTGMPGPDGAVDDVALWVRPAAGGNGAVFACDQPAGFVGAGGDCDDAASSISPEGVELCNGVDDDCDTVLDEEAGPLWYPDADGDGFGADRLRDCDDLMDAGVTTSGVYDIYPYGDDTSLQVYCNMDDDGGGWTRVFRHDSQAATLFFADTTDALEENTDDPTAPLYSILDQLERFRGADGAFEFRISWPGSVYDGRNVWLQTSNPTMDAVAGYEPVQIDYASQAWGGLERSTSSRTFIDGSVNISNWYYSIGSIDPWSGGAIPGPDTIPVDEVELYVRDLSGGPASSVQSCELVQGYAAAAGDCDDGDVAVGPGAPEVCNGVDDDCNDVVDDSPVTLPTSCADVLDRGFIADGVYTIDVEGELLDVWCDLNADDGGWTRIFRHDDNGGTAFFSGDADAISSNDDDPTAGLYAILDRLEAFRDADNTLELKINWPGSTTQPGRNIWTQTSNFTSESAAGYVPISIDYTDQFWAGLEYNTRTDSLADGSVGSTNWFYAIGSTRSWNGGIPGPNGVVDEVELWNRQDPVAPTATVCVP
jgi:hypothetical protein